VAYKVGDLVQLKSGGPKMTVTGVPTSGYADPHYSTSWFAGSKNEHGLFPEEALMLATEDEKKK
jgi:uncharacterized protein YodC (DUF2158 family)